MHIEIFTTMSAKEWNGEVPQMDLNEIFRFFNRVDEADCDRLETIGYNCPSLSSGDLIRIGSDEHFTLVCSVGFAQVTRQQAAFLKIRSLEAERGHDLRPPMFASVEADGTLVALTWRGQERVAPSGRKELVG